jgi:hypothetical protein
MQPHEPEEELEGPVIGDETRVPPVDAGEEQAGILREEREAELDEQPDTGWLEGNWVWLILVGIVVAIVVFVLVVALA